MNEPLIRASGLHKIYGGAVPFHALRGIDLTIMRGEMVAIMGTSGSGKSTLMNILGCLDRPSSGEFWLDGQRVSACSDDDLADLRARTLGFVFQSFHLLSRYTAVKNVELPLMYTSLGRRERITRASEALRRVGLGDRLNNRPNEMSGGQRQRVAIARALINRPAILLADEPTGALDTATSRDVMHLFQQLNQQGHTVIVVTHEEDVANYCRRIVRVRDGLVVEDRAIEPALKGAP